MADASRVLLVDDEPEIVEYLKIVLEGHGFDCLGVGTPEDGIAAANKEAFIAIISDMKMPKMSGLEMIAKIKTSTFNAKTPVVMLSGHLTDESMTSLEKMGIIDVMSKPPDIDILVRIIQKATKHTTKKTGKVYNPAIVKLFHDAYVATVKGHLAEKVTVTAAVVNESQLLNIEHCGMITLLGRRLSGVVTVSHQIGFTSEFAKVMMGREIVGKELEIFETSAAEMAEQVAQTIVPGLKNLGLYIEPTAPLIVHGRNAAIPLAGTQPRILTTATLNGKNCYLEFALVDLASDFAGQADSVDVKIVQEG
jgi:DNA-binding response OmpR family regulator